jgi:hypothetical protein
MTLLRAVAGVAVIVLFWSPLPAAAQAVSPNAAWSCMFASSPTDCSLYLQAAAPNRAALVTQARDGNNALELTTQPGDSNLFGSGTAERADVSLAPSSSYCNQGQEEWWAHSLMFPDNYVVPPAGSTWNWGVVFDFHHTGPSGQPNFQIVSLPTGLEFWIAGGPTVVNGPTDPGFYHVPIGTITKNSWYDFVYHVKWSSGNDGFFQAWVNGQQLLNYSGPTLYVGESCYLKLANYHTPLGVPISMIHERIVRGATQADVQMPSSGSTPPPPRSMAVYDFDGTGRSAILWRNVSTGQNQLWLMNAGVPTSKLSLATVSDLNWQVAGAGDFDGDGKADILWHNKAIGRNQIWFMNGGTITSAANISTASDPNWTVVGVGDFDGDHKADILWRNLSTGQNEVWLMNGGALVGSSALQTDADLNWTVVGVGDFDGDGKSDILWHNRSTGQNAIWFMNGAVVRQTKQIYGVYDLNWTIVGVGDFNGDGKSDILWRNVSSGKNAIRFMNGAAETGITYLPTVVGWSVGSVADYDGNGKADILWHNKATGRNQIWFMNGGTITSASNIATLPLAGWTIALH